jgi:CheY-like chemotaxis protein
MKKLPCILLIDDNEADNEFHKMEINSAGVAEQIKVVKTGMDAIEYLMQSAENAGKYPLPDLIFLDINMPGMNGFEFLAEARSLNVIPFDKVAVVMLSGSLNYSDRMRAKEEFPNEIREFCVKPLTGKIVSDLRKRYFARAMS